MAKKKVEAAIVEKVKTPRAPRKKALKEIVKEVETTLEEVVPVLENATYETTKLISEHKETIEETIEDEVKEIVVESVSLSTKIKLFFKNLFKKK